MPAYQNNRSLPESGKQQNRFVDLAIRSINKDERRVSVSFSSEILVSRWYGVEILSHDKNAVDLSRLNAIGVSLFNHNRDYILGKVENATLDEKERRCYADIVFDDDEQADRIFKKVDNGTLKGVSVGYAVDTWEEVAAGKTSSNGRFSGPCYVATKWSPMEISIVSVPADDSVGVGRELQNIEGDDRSNKEDKNMANGLSQDRTAGMAAPNVTTNPPAEQSPPEQRQQPATQNIDPEQVVKTERQRVSEIRSLCRGMNVDQATTDRYIDEGFTIDSVRKAVLDDQMKRNAPIPASQNPDVRVQADEADTFRAAASDGILLRGGIENLFRLKGARQKEFKPAPGANELRNIRLRELAQECLIRIGHTNVHRLSDTDLLRRNMTPDSQFQSILNTTVGATVRTSYDAAPATFMIWAGFDTNPDFKDKPIFRLSEAGEMVDISQGGEFTYDEMQDEKVTSKLKTKGRGFAFTREAMINDDLNVLVKVPMAFTISYVAGINKAVYTLLGTATTKYKGANLFSTDRKNLASSGATISTATIKAGKTAMRRMKNQRGIQVLQVTPAFMIVPPELEHLAGTYLGSSTDPDGENPGVINIYKNSMEPVVDAELTDEYAWFMAANPALIDTIIVCYLNGQKIPILESFIPQDRLGILFHIYGDYGVTVGDYLGLYKNAGH